MTLVSSAILERFSLPAFLIDECGRLCHANARACQALGYEAAGLGGLLFAELDVSLPAGEWAYYHRRVLAGQTSRPEEHLLLTRTGEVIRMEVEADRLETDGGQWVLVLAKPCRGRDRSGSGPDRRVRFLSFLESVPGLVARFDRELRVDYASHDLARRLGRMPGALSGLHLARVSDAWVQPLRQAVESVLRSGEACETLHEALTGEGRVTETVHVLPVRNARDEIEAALAYGETAAEHVLRTAAMHSMDEPFREIFQAVPDGLFLLKGSEDERFIVVDVNPAFARFVGRSRGELTGRYLDEIMPSDHVKSHTAKFLRCMSAGDRIEEQGRLVAATGPLWYGAILTPLRDAGGRVVGIVGIFRDIAEKMHMRAALQESERRYHEIVERSADSIFLLEATPDGRFRAIAANPAFETTFGFRREDYIGRLLEEVVPRPLADFLTQRYIAVVESGVTRDAQLELELPNGHHRLNSTLIPMKDSAANVRRLMVIAREMPLEGGTVPPPGGFGPVVQ